MFDQNLSPGLVRSLSDLHPDPLHVRDVDLGRALDAEIWTFLDRSQVLRKLTLELRDLDSLHDHMSPALDRFVKNDREECDRRRVCLPASIRNWVQTIAGLGSIR